MPMQITMRQLPRTNSLRYVQSLVGRLGSALYLGLTGARERLQRIFPQDKTASEEILRVVVADEYGYGDWDELESAVATANARGVSSASRRIVDAVYCGDIGTLHEVALAHPREVARPRHPGAFSHNGLMMHDADQVADCVRYLTDLGARFDHLTSWNLESTIKYAPRACSLYIRSGAPQYNGEGLHTMAALGCIGGLELLLSVSANGINRKDSEGFDPASIAAERGHINTLAWLLRKGAKVSDTLWDTLHKTGFLALENVIAGNVPYSVRQERGLPGWTSGTVRWMDFYDGCIVSRDGVDVFFSRDAVEEGDYVCALEQGTDVTFILAPSIVPVASRVKLISLTPLR